MHKINKARLLAGLPIDASYERKLNGTATAVVETTNSAVIEKTQLERLQEATSDLSSLSQEDLNTAITILEAKISELYGMNTSTINEAKVFMKGADVEDKKGQCFKVVSVVGNDDNDEPVYKVVCPKSGETSYKSGMTLRVAAAKKESVETKDVVLEKEVEVMNFDNDDSQPKTPAVVTPQPQKTKVPANVKKDLQTAIASFEHDARMMKTRDEANALFHEQIADAMKKLNDLMHEDIKQAQIFLSSLMGPILHKIPSSVCKFVYSGGDKSLKSYFNK